MFFVIIITVQIQHYCLYSVSPTLLLLMMPRPPAPSALWFYMNLPKNESGDLHPSLQQYPKYEYPSSSGISRIWGTNFHLKCLIKRAQLDKY